MALAVAVEVAVARQVPVLVEAAVSVTSRFMCTANDTG
jgi:hypothetical protein